MKKLTLILALGLTACAPHYSSGSRVGTVTKLSYKGLIWKSWEGSLNQGGVHAVPGQNGSTNIVPNAMDFNAQDPAVIAELQRAMQDGKPRELHYEQWLVAPPFIENGHVITEVKEVQ